LNLACCGTARASRLPSCRLCIVLYCTAAVPQGSPDSYAVLALYDPNRKPIPNIEFRTGGGRTADLALC
jgi:hypothetical protein